MILLYTFFILVMLPFFPLFWAWASRHFPQGVKILTAGLIVLGGFLLLFYWIFVKRIRSLFFYFWLTVIFLFYGLLIYFYCRFPAERLHVAEYGLSAFLTHWCLRARIKKAWIYPFVLSYSLLIGWLDEGIQYFLPNRFYEFRDLLVNWIASFLTVAVLWIGNLRRFEK